MSSGVDAYTEIRARYVEEAVFILRRVDPQIDMEFRLAIRITCDLGLRKNQIADLLDASRPSISRWTNDGMLPRALAREAVILRLIQHFEQNPPIQTAAFDLSPSRPRVDHKSATPNGPTR